MQLLNQMSTCWKKTWSFAPLKYFPPLSDPTTFGIIIAQCLWTWVIVTFIKDEVEPLPFDVEKVFGILTATLGFILPLQLSAALTKNHSCVDNYNAFCGDVLAFAWECVGLTKGNKVTEEKSEELENMFHILVAFPTVVKHHFRGSINLSLATSLGGSKLIDKNGSLKQRELEELYNRLIVSNQKGMCEVEICFMKLLDYVKDYAEEEKNVDPVRRSLLATWNRVYSSFGNISNISSYIPPVIFTYVLNVALVLYSIILPLTVYDQGLNAIWMVAIVSYFFLGMNIAGQKVGNAFAASEDAEGFQNVTESQKTATKAIEQVWKERRGIARYSATRNTLDYF